MKRKITKIFGVALALVFAFSTTFAFSVPVMADEEEWDTLGLPSEAAVGDWFMDEELDGIGPFARAIDGTFYLYMDHETAANDDLYTSDDDGRTWEATGYATDFPAAGAPVDIACSSDDADVLYVATATNVYKSEEAGDTDSWENLGNPDATVTAITCIAVGYEDENPHIYVGTAEGPGEVWYYEDAPFASVWTDLQIAAPDNDGAINVLDVWGIAVSPDFDNDTLVVAVTDNGTAGGSFVIANVGAGIGVNEWDDLELLNDAVTPASFVITEAANPVFVEDFDIDDDYELFVGVSGPVHIVSGLGGVYRITGSTERDDFLLDDVDDDVASLDLVGDLGGVSLLAGTTITAPVTIWTGPASIWYSTDDGDDWDETDKAPTGRVVTGGDIIENLVIVDEDFADSGVAWCASYVSPGGKEGGVHLTTDFGASWNGISMIDTDMRGDVYDVTFTADYGTDDAPLFMVTECSENATDDSVWKYDGDYWERVWLDDTNSLDLVEVSPAYAEDTAVFIADSAAPMILYSHDGSATFDEMIRTPVGDITAWLAIDDETIITGDADGDYYKTTRYGRRIWDTDTISEDNVITDFALSPNFASDGTILAGDDASQVHISTDEGEEWDEVSDDDLITIVRRANATTTYVAFDLDYATNDTFYAASDDSVARCEIDSGEDWGDQEFDDMNVTDAGNVVGFDTASGLVASADGTLYVTSADAVVLEAATAVAEVEGDAFSIIDPTGGDSGNIAWYGTITTSLGGTATFTPGALGTATWTTPAANDAIIVEAATDGVFGTWDNTGGTNTAIAAIISDADADASVWTGGTAGVGPFALPDAEVAAVVVGEGAGGVARCLNPTDVLADIEWELPQAGFDAGETFAAIGSATNTGVSSLELTYGSNVLWAIDTTPPTPDVVTDSIDAIWTYEDTLAAPVVLISPADGATGEETDEVTFEWEALNEDTVTNYRLKLNEKEDFTGPDLGEAVEIEDDTEFTFYDLDSGTTYYWKVAVTDPVSSRYSEVWSFRTKVGKAEAPVEVRPLPGAQDVILEPTFNWKAITGAATYEIEVATDADFANIVATGTPETNIWAIDVALSYSTNYYWRVRGISAEGAPEGSWIISIFTTMEKPEKAPAPVEVEVPPAQPAPEITVETIIPITPAYIWSIIVIGALLIIALIILIVRTRRVV